MKKLAVLPSVALAAFAGFAADVAINVPDGVTQDFYTALAANGKTVQDLKDNKLVKTGGGTLVGTNEMASVFKNMDINAGVFSARVEGDLGVRTFATYNITVKDGATFRLDGGSSSTAMLLNRCVGLSGTGAPGEGGAVVCSGKSVGDYIAFKLGADATIATSYADGPTYCFKDGPYGDANVGRIDLNGHDLTLRTLGDGVGYVLVKRFDLRGDGRIVVDGAYFGQDPDPIRNLSYEPEIGYTTLVLKNGATFRPRSQGMVSLFDSIDLSSDSTIAGEEGGSAAFDLAIGGWVGTGAVSGLSSLTVSDTFTVRVSDLLDGNILSLECPLVFADGALFAVEGDLFALDPGATGRVKIAESSAGIEGCPTVFGQLGRHWSLEKSADGKSLELVYDPQVPAGAIDVVADWGLVPGAGATGNAALFNAKLAALSAAKPVLYFPAGDYVFEAPIAIGEKTGVTLMGDEVRGVLRAGEGVASLIDASGSTDCTITDLAFVGTTGPAVTATGATGLSVLRNTYVRVGGAIADAEGTYPVNAVDSTNVRVLDNRILDGVFYAAAVRLANSTKAADGEPIGGQVRIYVPVGETLTLSTALTQSGRTAYPLDARLVKTGGGTLVGEAAYGSLLRGVTVQEGVYSVASDDCFGIRQKWNDSELIRILPGGTLLFDSTNPKARIFFNRNMFVGGSGAPGMGGAIVFSKRCRAYCEYSQMTLTDDAVFATYLPGEYARYLKSYHEANKPPYRCRVRFSGHSLTLRTMPGAYGFTADCGIQIGEPSNGEDLIVDGGKFGQADEDLVPAFEGKAKPVRLVLRNGAEFRPRSQGFIDSFLGIAADSTSTIVGVGESEFDLTVGEWFGAGTVVSGVSSLVVTNAFTARVSDLASGGWLKVQAPLAFGAGTCFRTEGDLFTLKAGSSGRVKVAASESGIEGCPQVMGVLNGHWTLVKPGDDALEIAYDPQVPEGSIDVVADWGLVPGAGATGNAALFNAKLAALAAADPVLYFPAGDYVFEAPLVIGAKSGVTIAGDDARSVFRAGADLASLIDASGSTGCVISNLAFAGTTGPAVTASGAADLSVLRSTYTAIGGAIADVEGAYPVNAENSTNVRVLDNRILDGVFYTAAVRLENSTKAADGEPLDAQVRLYVPTGETLPLATAMTQSGRTEYPQDFRLVKAGGGTLIADPAYGSWICGVTVAEGVLSVDSNTSFGRQRTWGNAELIKVLPGGTLLFDTERDTAKMLWNRTLEIGGSGAPGMGGAIVFSWRCRGYCEYAQMTLTDDAVFATYRPGEFARFFKTYHEPNRDPYLSSIFFKGYDLTLLTMPGAYGFTVDYGIKLKKPTGGENLIVRGGVFGQTDEAEVSPFRDDGAGLVRLVLRDGAEFRPRSQSCVGIYSGIDCDATSSVVGSGASAFALTIGDWLGAGSVVSGISSFSITNGITSYAADITADKVASFACPVAISSGVKLRIADPDGIFAGLPRDPVRYACLASDVSLSGTVGKDRTSDFKSWKAGTTSDTLCIDTYLGTLLLVR